MKFKISVRHISIIYNNNKMYKTNRKICQASLFILCVEVLLIEYLINCGQDCMQTCRQLQNRVAKEQTYIQSIK